MNISITTTLLKYKAAILILLSLLIVTVGLHILQPTSAKADDWGQCMTGGWVGPTWYSYDCSASEAAAANSCTTAGGSFSVIGVPSECTVICSDAYDWYYCDFPPPPTCASFPTMDGCACSKTNVCNTDTTNGAFSGGTCNAPEPAACCAVTTCPAPSAICSGDSCVATASDCSTATVSGTATGGSCPSTCAVTTCPAPSAICSGDSCVATASDCSTATVSGTATGGSCSPPSPTATLQTQVNGGAWLSGNQTVLSTDTLMLRWASTDATSCNVTAGAAAGFSTAGAPSGTDAVTTPAVGGSTTFGASCSGPGGSTGTSITINALAPPPPDPGLTLTTNKTNVRKNETVTLTWASAAVAVPSDWSCKIFGPGGVSASTRSVSGGSTSSGQIIAKSQFVLSCTHNPSNTTFVTSPVIVETTGEIQEI